MHHPMIPSHTDKGRSTICGTLQGATETEGKGDEEEQLILGGHVDTRGHESLRVPRYQTRPRTPPSPGVTNKGNPQGGPPVPRGDVRRIHRDTPCLVPPSSKIGLAQDEWVVQVGKQLRSSIHPTFHRVDHEGAGHPIPAHNTPGREYPGVIGDIHGI